MHRHADAMADLQLQRAVDTLIAALVLQGASHEGNRNGNGAAGGINIEIVPPATQPSQPSTQPDVVEEPATAPTTQP